MAPIAPPKAVSCSASGSSGFWYPESCSIGFWTSSSAPSIAAPSPAPCPPRPRKVSAPSLSLSAHQPALLHGLERPFLRAKLGFDRPHGCRPERRNCLALGVRLVALVGCYLRFSYPGVRRERRRRDRPNVRNDLPGPATTGAAVQVNGAAAVIPVPSTRAPSMVPMEPAAFPTASLTAVQGCPRSRLRLFTAV